MNKEINVLAATSMLGAGYLESSLEKGLSWNADFIGCDAGSTDGGPSRLGTGACGYSKAAVKCDLRLALLAARRKKIPLLIGSAGSAGGNLNLAWTVEIAKEIAREEQLHFTLAVIHAEQGAISREIFTRLYGTPDRDVEIYSVDSARGIKVTIPRPITQGDLEDADMAGCQFFGPLTDIEIPD